MNDFESASEKLSQGKSNSVDRRSGGEASSAAVSRARMDDALEDSDLLRAFVTSCRDAVIACSLDGVIRLWNPGAVKAYGWEASAAVGRQATLAAPLECREELEQIAANATQGRSTPAFETLRVAADGRTLPVVVVGFPVLGRDGEPVGFALLERDISEEVAAAEALREARIEARKGSEAKSRFLANISHELRTPLSAIVGMTGLALEEELSPTVKEYLHTVQDSSETLLLLLNNVLDLTLIESEEFELDCVEFHLRELVESVAASHGPMARQKGLELLCRIDPLAPRVVVGDPVRLRQAISSLLDNALEFSQRGEVLVDATVIARDVQQCDLLIAISDNGPGIAEQDLKETTEPFTQIDSSTTRSHGGAGLGLAITRRLAEAFGGELMIDTVAGRGSRFSFALRLAIPADLPPLVDSNEGVLQGQTVLVVSPSRAFRRIASEFLTTAGAHPIGLSGAGECLGCLAESRTPVSTTVVIDENTPVRHRIVEAVARRGLPCVLVGDGRRRDPSVRGGFAPMAYVEKPTSASQLVSAVVAVTHPGISARSEAPASSPRTEASRRVLVVDDTPASRKLVSQLLLKRGHEVTQATNGAEAVLLFQTGDYDVILMDVQMPVLDGFDATATIRRVESIRHRRHPLPIVAMTANALRADRERCLAVGMTGYLSKPIAVDQLYAAVEGAPKRLPPVEHNRDPENAKVPSLGKTMAPSTSSESVTATTVPPRTEGTGVDLGPALTRFRGDTKLLADMIGFFLEDSSSLCDSIAEAIEKGDRETVLRMAHSLKGLAANFEDGGTTRIAGSLELAAGANDLAAAQTMVGSLREEVALLAAALSQWLKEHRDPRGTSNSSE